MSRIKLEKWNKRESFEEFRYRFWCYLDKDEKAQAYLKELNNE